MNWPSEFQCNFRTEYEKLTYKALKVLFLELKVTAVTDDMIVVCVAMNGYLNSWQKMLNNVLCDLKDFMGDAQGKIDWNKLNKTPGTIPLAMTSKPEPKKPQIMPQQMMPKAPMRQNMPRPINEVPVQVAAKSFTKVPQPTVTNVMNCDKPNMATSTPGQSKPITTSAPPAQSKKTEEASIKVAAANDLKRHYNVMNILYVIILLCIFLIVIIYGLYQLFMHTKFL